MAAMVARRRLDRGVKLDHPDVALITDFVVEGARDGRSVARPYGGAHILKREQVMDGVSEMIHDVQVEATFPDGASLSLCTSRSAEDCDVTCVPDAVPARICRRIAMKL
jgi:urease subunit gamma